MPTSADDIINEALSELGVVQIGDVWEGSRAAESGRRIYDTLLRGLHESTDWNFARRQRQIDLRGDAAGQYSNNINVPMPWRFMYEWPNDCVHAWAVLGTDAAGFDASGTPIVSSMWWHHPAPFLITNASLVNDVASDWHLVEGHSPESTRVIATDQLGASLVYTGIVQYPDTWPPLFRRAMVSALAARLALAAIEDKGAARAIRGDQLAIAKEALIAAQVRDANQGPNVFQHTPDWIRVRDFCWADEGTY
jgi:hypothetical protein